MTIDLARGRALWQGWRAVSADIKDGDEVRPFQHEAYCAFWNWLTPEATDELFAKASEAETAKQAQARVQAELEHSRAGARKSWDRAEESERREGQLREALERGRGCINGLLARTPVRDVAETLAEIDAALAALPEPKR